MASKSYFLTKTEAVAEELILIGETPVIENYDALYETLTRHGRVDAAELFAEPVFRRGNSESVASISWYCSYVDDAKPLTALDESARTAVEKRLRRGLLAAAECLKDKIMGPLVGAALHVRSLDDIYVLGDRPVIVNWGILPAADLQTQATRNRHYAETIGKYLPLAEAPPITSEEWGNRMSEATQSSVDNRMSSAAASETRTATPVSQPAAAKVLPTNAGISERTTIHRSPDSHWYWAPLILLLVLMSLTLLWLLWPGNLLYPTPPAGAAVSYDDAIAAAEEANQSLRERRDALREAMEGAICTAEGELVLPSQGGVRPDGTLPLPAQSGNTDPPRTSEAGPDALLPPNPERIEIPAEEGNPATLLTYLEERTAIVLLLGQDDQVNMGTGFFIAPDLLVTNHHVIAVGATDTSTIMVTNNRLGQLTSAKVLRSDGPLEQTGRDFALLQVQGVQMPFFSIRSGTESIKLQNVVAAGFPKAYLDTDFEWQRLLQGDISAAPEMVTTRGFVSAEQNFGGTTLALVHSADISGGNSGGPLVDSCGRVVGVNTFGRHDDRTSRFLNFSLHATELLEFLGEVGISSTTESEPCRPQVVAQAPLPRSATNPAPADRTYIPDDNQQTE